MSEQSGGEQYNFDVWQEVERISFGRVIPGSKEALLDFIEAPFKDAIGGLYDKNILTLGSSCNVFDYYNGFAWISLDWETLSLPNRDIVNSYPHSLRTTIDGTSIQIVGLQFPIAVNDKPDDISHQASELANQFELQIFSWVPKWSIDEARLYFSLDGKDLRSCSENEFLENMLGQGYYFDYVDKLIYNSEEQYRKFIESS